MYAFLCTCIYHIIVNPGAYVIYRSIPSPLVDSVAMLLVNKNDWYLWYLRPYSIIINCLTRAIMLSKQYTHHDVIKWKHCPRYWPFVWGIHRSPVNSPHKGQWRGALIFSLIGAWINHWVNNPEAGDLRGHRAHYDVTVMSIFQRICTRLCPGYIISSLVLDRSYKSPSSDRSYKCPRSIIVTLKDLGKIGRYPTQTKREPCAYCF